MRNFIFTISCCLLVLGASAQTMSPDVVQQTARHLIQKRASKVRKALTAYEQGQRRQPNSGVQLRNAEPDNITRTGDAESEIHAAINPLDSNNLITAAIKWETGGFLPTMKVPIYSSTDFGETWTLNSFDVSEVLEGLEIIAGGGDPVITFTSDGTAIFSWLLLTLDILSQETKLALYAATSDDLGVTWTLLDEPVDFGVMDGALSENPSGRFVDKQWMASDQTEGKFAGNTYMTYAEISAADSLAFYQILTKRLQPDATAFDSAYVVIADSSEFLFCQFPTIDVDSEGTVHILFTGAKVSDQLLALYYVQSTDGGLSYTEPSLVSEISLTCFPPGISEESCIDGVDPNRTYPSAYIVADKSGGATDGTLHVVWSGTGLDTFFTEGYDIYYTRSLNNGGIWETPRVLNQDADTEVHNFYPTAAVSSNGTLVVNWYDRRLATDTIPTTHYYLTSSTDGGDTFDPEVQVTSEGTDFSTIGSKNQNFGIGEYNGTVTTPNTAIPFWADGRAGDGNLEIYFARVDLAGDVTTSVSEWRNLENDLQLRGPLPNPASDRAMLQFELSEAGPVQIDLFDVQGRLVKTIRNNQTNLSTGTHTVDFGISELPAGLYQLRVLTERGQIARPLMVR